MTFKVWIDSVTKPKETFSAEKQNSDFVKGSINYVIAGIVGAILGLVISLAMGSPFAGLQAMSIVISPVVGVVAALIVTLIYFIVSKLFGGHGAFKEIYHLMSLYQVPMAILSAIPIVNILAWLYSLYLFYLVIMETQGLSSGKSIIVVLLPIVVLGIILAVLAVVVGVAIFSMFAPALQAGTGAFGLGG
ncbi:MAG: YIP1 family protein [archaeon]|nr:YIP1 family protein [archaeon]